MRELEKSWYSIRKKKYEEYLGKSPNTWYYLRYFIISIKENQAAKPMNLLRWNRRFDSIKFEKEGE